MHQNCRNMLVMVMGLPGSGKTFFAKRLAERLGFSYIGSDQVRKEMHAMGKYSNQEKQKVYKKMLVLAKTLLQEGKSVIVDTTFYQEAIRLQFEQLAQHLFVPLLKFWIVAPVEVIKERLSAPREDSEADFGVYQKLASTFEAPSMPYIKLISSQNNIDDMLVEAERYLVH